MSRREWLKKLTVPAAIGTAAYYGNKFFNPDSKKDSAFTEPVKTIEPEVELALKQRKQIEAIESKIINPIQYMGSMTALTTSILDNLLKIRPHASIEEAAQLMAQMKAETGGFTRLSEFLGYDTPMILATTFPGRIASRLGIKYKKGGLSKYQPDEQKKIVDYSKKLVSLPDNIKQIIIANLVYSNFLGNGDPLSGDGWHYRGRGFLQITGKSQYSQFGYINNPDILITDFDKALHSALSYWADRIAKSTVDFSDTHSITVKLRGVGDSRRTTYYNEFINNRVFRELFSKIKKQHSNKRHISPKR